MSDYKVNEATMLRKAEWLTYLQKKFEAATSIVVASSRGLTVRTRHSTSLKSCVKLVWNSKLLKTQSCVVQLKKLDSKV